MNKIALIGVDPSSKKLAAVITLSDQSMPEIWSRSLADNISRKCFWAHRWIKMLVTSYVKRGYEVVFFIEDPVVGRGGAHSTIVQARVNGAALSGAVMGGAKEIHTANNARWKKIVVGKGSASKPDIKKWCRIEWPVLFRLANGDQDLCDAAGINAYGDHVLKLQKRIEKNRQKEKVGK